VGQSNLTVNLLTLLVGDLVGLQEIPKLLY